MKDLVFILLLFLNGQKKKEIKAIYYGKVLRMEKKL